VNLLIKMKNMNSDMNLDEKIENEIIMDESDNCIQVILNKRNCIDGIKECKKNMEENLLDENELLLLKENSNQGNDSLPIRMAKEQILRV